MWLRTLAKIDESLPFFGGEGNIKYDSNCIKIENFRKKNKKCEGTQKKRPQNISANSRQNRLKSKINLRVDTIFNNTLGIDFLISILPSRTLIIGSFWCSPFVYANGRTYLRVSFITVISSKG